MTIPLHAIPLPTTTSLHAIPYSRLSIAEERQRRASEAGQRTNPCPHCGEWSIVETVTRNRPGLPAIVQTLSRCQRTPRWKEERCPLTVLHEEWAEEDLIQHEELEPEEPILGPLPAQEYVSDSGRPECRPTDQDANEARPGPEEEMMEKTRPCADCGASIEDSHGRMRCRECSNAHRKAQKQAQNARTRARKRVDRALSPNGDNSANGWPVPVALRVSVLDLAQRAAVGTGIRATMMAILALSQERQDLLKRILEDMEAA